MRIGTSRADRLGFIVFAVLAALLATLFVTSLGNDSTETAQQISTFADLPEPTAIETTAPLSVPDPDPTATPWPTSTPPPATATPEPTAEAATTEGDSATGGASDSSAAASSNNDTDAAPAPAANSGSNAAAQPAATAVPNPQPAADATAVPNPQPATDATAVPNPQPATDQPINVPAPNPTGGTFTHVLTATATGQITLYSSPGGAAFMPSFGGTALPAYNPTVFGRPLVYPVIAGTPGDAWAQVKVPAGGNSTTAWVQTSQFSWGSSNRKIIINVGNNTVTVYEGANVLLTTSAVTGKSSSPTPIASGWVEEIMPGPSGAYGPTLISLGMFSTSLSSFGGSVPKIALHGTNNPSLMGQYQSNGCIRLRNEIITQVASLVPPGSLVQVINSP